MSKRVLDDATIAWRDAVLSRDNKTCVECGSTKWLHAHHIKAYATCEEGRYDIDNGETLCRDCHSKKHPHQEKLILSSKQPKRPTSGIRRSLSLSARHDKMLVDLAHRLDLSITETASRALEELEYKIAKRCQLLASAK